MVILAEAEVLVITMDRSLDPALQQIATRRGWQVMVRPTRAELLREVRRCRPRAILTQVSAPPLLEELRVLIGGLRSRSERLAVIAVAAPHTEEMERAMRSAGVTAFVAAGTEPQILEQTVTRIGAVARVPPPRAHSPPAVRDAPIRGDP